jgi:transposase
MLLVEIEKPANISLSEWFSELRDWLDANHCTPSVFSPSGRRIDGLIYRISFDNAALAHRFSLRFKRYLPVVRRATPFERDQLRAMSLKAGAAD